MNKQYVPFAVFWASYLEHHQHPITRLLHWLGTSLVLVGVGGAFATRTWWLLPMAFAVGYLFAFGGHWWVERNQPMTFKHPLRAGLCNMRLFAHETIGIVTGHNYASLRGHAQLVVAGLSAAGLLAGCETDPLGDSGQ